MAFTTARAVQLLHRPHLMLDTHALDWAGRIARYDVRAFERPTGAFAALRKLGLGGAPKPAAFHDDDDDRPSRPSGPPQPEAYTPLWMGEPDAKLGFGVTLKDGIAVMEVAGPLAERGEWVCGEFIHGYDTIRAAIGEADASGSVRGILVRLDTPGGVVAGGLDDLASMMLERRGKAGAKPLWVHCEMACSAGYWIASQADRVVAPRAGMVGSIGAVMVHQSIAGALKEMGVSVTAIQFGAHKTDGAMWKDLSPDAQARLQTLIDEIGESFLAAVAAGRGAKFGAEAARETQARVYSASEALGLGMIDAVMSEEAAFAELRAKVSAPAVIPFRSGMASASGEPAAAAAQPTETSMKLNASHLPALAAAMAASPALAAMIETAVQPAEDDAGGVPGDPADGGEDDEDETGEASQAPADAPAAATVDPAVASAVLDLPEARGREQLAKRLAFEPGMTVAKAKGFLAAAPKASRLAERVQDPGVSAHVGEDNRTDAVKLAQQGLVLAGLAPKKAG